MTVDLTVSRRLGTTLVSTFKTLTAHRRKLPRPHPHADQSALPLMFTLEHEPLRISALADAVHSDISTVSRQVSALSEGNLVTKVCDAHDRRAQLVALTEEGNKLVASMREDRGIWVQRILRDWTTAEAVEFERLLAKFSDSMTRFDTENEPETHATPATS